MSPANLELLSRFYQKYPEYADKTFLSVKVGLIPAFALYPTLTAFFREAWPLECIQGLMARQYSVLHSLQCLF